MKFVANVTKKLPSWTSVKHPGPSGQGSQQPRGTVVPCMHKYSYGLPSTKWQSSDSIGYAESRELGAYPRAAWRSSASVTAARVEARAVKQHRALSRTGTDARQRFAMNLDGEVSARTSVDTSFDSGHHFSFDLIPLPEAVRVQAECRASGQLDPTMSGSFSSLPSTGSQRKRGKRARLPSIEWAGVRKAFHLKDKSKPDNQTSRKDIKPSTGAGGMF
jgi:hypothetical protein